MTGRLLLSGTSVGLPCPVPDKLILSIPGHLAEADCIHPAVADQEKFQGHMKALSVASAGTRMSVQIE